ncbi:PepSY-like domain-containing protein [Parapedobacter koreensis]|uniref:Putative beta-lactamase-inhibitor-like, PepSY-like n=1 Tax=Parapedobacter koreensis TaxID=332977 RepID=A0A1H7GGK7_9SPHI|nr:PepSY-like domain-containing protein [Parapedobacter koreensis]SEK37214.1 Putative beta-lactamase-inhibitor-like, PepSY-like [Parapedobacter koreensis]
MKKVIYLTALMGVALGLLTACDKESIVSVDGLPANAQTYITQHFPSYEILQVIKERDDLKTTYEVYLSEGYHLDFDKKGSILGIEGTNKLPDSVVPEKILAYVEATYPSEFILDWELDSRRQEIKLSNRMELEFDLNGNFLRID